MARVVGTHTAVRVRWQDGTVSESQPSVELVPLVNITDSDFWPDDLVIDKVEESAAAENDEPQRTGLVISVNAAARTADVHWLRRRDDGRLDLPAEGSLPGELGTETVAVYDLDHAPEFDVHVGTIVLLLDVDTASAGSSVAEAAPFVGQILAKRLGRLTISWADGSVRTHSPEEVFPVAGADGDDDDEEEEEEGEWEEALDEAELTNFWLSGAGAAAMAAADADAEEEDEDEDEDEGDDDGDASLWESAGEEDDLTPQADAAAVPARTPTTTAADDEAAERARQRASMTLAAMRASLPTNLTPRQTSASTSVAVALPVVPHAQPVSAPTTPATAAVPPVSSLPQFDTVTGDVDDHHYSSEASSSGAPSRAWSRSIAREWALLQAELPHGIWVRAYEDRTDLLRAVIAGAAETPYGNHAFVFDIFLPPAFPEEPPQVHYVSHGLRANPNLYACGKVCLSLLGTWQGKDNKGEAWRPGESNVLQVLLSIQALVLNAEPYFNEPAWSGLQGSDEGTRNSAEYNEQVRLVCLRSCCALLRAPPAHVGDILRAHYASTGRSILEACDAELRAGAGASADNTASPSSEGFRASLAKLMPKLRDALKSS